MEISSCDKGYNLIFYEDVEITYNSEDETNIINIPTREKLLKIHDKIEEILLKERGYED